MNSAHLKKNQETARALGLIENRRPGARRRMQCEATKVDNRTLVYKMNHKTETIHRRLAETWGGAWWRAISWSWVLVKIHRGSVDAYGEVSTIYTFEAVC